MKDRKQTARVKAMASKNANNRAMYNAVQIEQWLRDNKKNEIEFFFTVKPDLVTVMFVANDPDTGDQVGIYEGYCMRFSIEPKAAIDNLTKYLRQESIIDR